MEENTTPTKQEQQNHPQEPTSRNGGYLATIIGADLGFFIGGLIGFLLGISLFDINVVFSFNNLASVLLAVIGIGVGGAIGGILGCYLALSMTKQRRKGRTALLLGLMYPVPLLLAGSDFFIGALVLPLLARWLALR